MTLPLLETDDVAVAGEIHPLAVSFERNDRVPCLLCLHLQN